TPILPSAFGRRTPWTALYPLSPRLKRRAIAQKHAQALLQIGGGAVERIRRLDARTHLVPLHFRKQEKQHRIARFKQVAVFGEPFREDDSLEMSGRIGQADDAHLAAGAGAPLEA